MQLAIFDKSCESIEAICSSVYHELRYAKTFKNEKRKDFNLALTSLFHVLHQDIPHLYKKKPLWHTAYRIIRLTELSQKMESILQKIYTNGIRYFCHTLKKKVLPSLANRIQDLNLLIMGNYRLPFSLGTTKMCKSKLVS